MQTEEYIPVGKLGRPHGISGAFRFHLVRKLKNAKKFPEYFLLEVNGRKIPFFVTAMELQNSDGGLLKLEGIVTPEAARVYSGSELFLKEADINIYFNKNAKSIDYLIGYLVVDQVDGEVGVIAGLLDTPAQVLAEISGDGKHYTIPLVEDWIVEINNRKRQIYMSLPDGLLRI